MPSGGHNRKPAELHKLQGTGRNDRGTDVILEIHSAFESDYDYVKGIDRDELFEHLKNWVTFHTGRVNIDKYLLSQLVDYYEIFYKAKSGYEELGTTVTTERGSLVKNPNIGIMNDAHMNIRRIMYEFGMTPVSRSKLAVNEDAEKTAIDVFLEGVSA